MSEQAKEDLDAQRQSMAEPEASTAHESLKSRPSDPERPSVEPMWRLIKRLPRYARLSAALARDARVPGSAKAMLAVGGLYLVSPIDLVPGIIPVAGQLDDLYVVLMGLQLAIRATPDDIIDEHFAAFDLKRSCVDDELATIREFVRCGVTWSLSKGGQVLARCSRQAMALAQRARQQGVIRNDKKPIQPGTSSTQP